MDADGYNSVISAGLVTYHNAIDKYHLMWNRRRMFFTPYLKGLLPMTFSLNGEFLFDREIILESLRRVPSSSWLGEGA